MSLRMGELFAGYGGLGMGVAEVLDVDLAWVSEFDKGPSKVLAHRFPGVPNHGDITKIDWSQVEPVDVLTGGSPCQDLSHAGARKGMTEGTRSNLWVAMREAIAQLRPGLVVWENVRGAYSAEATSSGTVVKSRERRPGGRSSCRVVYEGGLLENANGGPTLRALGRVLGDLSDLGYDAQWHGLRAADVGAPHGRFRVFVVAYLRTAVSLMPTPRATDGTKGGPNQRGSSGDLMLPSAVAGLLPTPTARDWKNAGDPAKTAGRMADRGQPLTEIVVNNLLPTPAVNDMGASYTPDEWDAWTDRMKAEHGNGNGHGKSLHIEAARLLPTPSVADSMGGHLSRAGDRSNELLLPGVAKEIAHASTAQGGSSEELRDVREAADSQEVREREARGSDGVPQAEELLSGVREHSGGSDPLGTRLPSEAAQEADMRGVRDERPPARTSPRPELGERRPGQPGNALCLMPSASALAGGSRGPCGCGTAWGQYEAAIRRWEQVLGHCAPPPTELGPKGNPRLSPRFSEFMMGVPAGWITDVPGITRNEALKLAGNGVVPQQCAAALRIMLARMGQVAA